MGSCGKPAAPDDLTLRGTWELAETTDGARVSVSRHDDERTLLTFLCKDAAPIEIALVRTRDWQYL